MPPRIKALAEHFDANKPGRHPATALSEMARRVAAREPVSLPLEEIYIAHSGFSSAELAQLAFDEAALRVSRKELEAGRFALQRETARRRRQAGRSA